jgi:hypothetical protein
VARPPLPPTHSQLLEEFGFEWNKQLDTWSNRHAGRAISYETVAAWTVEQLRAWLERAEG